MQLYSQWKAVQGYRLATQWRCLGSLKGHYTVSKSKGPTWWYFTTPAAARGFLATKRRICHAISDAPSFFLGKGASWNSLPQKPARQYSLT